MKDCTTCKYGYEDERLGIQMCHHPKRFSEDCVDFNMHKEKEIKESEKPIEIDFEQELYKHFGMVKDFTLGMRIGQYFYELGCRRTAEKYDEIEYNKQRAEESVPNDLEEAAKKFVGYDMDCDELRDYEIGIASFIAGAKWQEEKDARDMYMSDNRHFEKVYQLGKTDMCEQMMKEAVEGEISSVDVGDDSYVKSLKMSELQKAIRNYNVGDKIRIIIIKDDEKSD